MAVPPQMTIGSPQVIHVGAFSQLHTATTIATHMTRPTMSRIAFFIAPSTVLMHTTGPPTPGPTPTQRTSALAAPKGTLYTGGMLIAFLGDSLTEGWPGAAYFPLLDRRMSRHGLLNRGRAGDTVADLLTRMRYQGLEPVDCAFIWVGANDAVMGAWDASEAGSGWSWPERLMRLAGDYEELLEWTEARAPRVVVVRPLVLEAEGSLWEERAAEVAEAIARIAAGRRSCRAVDLRPAFTAAAEEGDGPFTTDGVHFTEAGAEVVARVFAAVIAELASEDEPGEADEADERAEAAGDEAR
jgi:lysophospholipase L1-like esterase